MSLKQRGHPSIFGTASVVHSSSLYLVTPEATHVKYLLASCYVRPRFSTYSLLEAPAFSTETERFRQLRPISIYRLKRTCSIANTLESVEKIVAFAW